MRNFVATLISVSAFGLAAPAFAQDTAAPAAEPATTAEAPAAETATAKAGDTVYDSAGDTVGTIESVDGGNAVLSTGSLKATVALSAISSGPKGPTISMTKAQLEAAIRSAGE